MKDYWRLVRLSAAIVLVAAPALIRAEQAPKPAPVQKSAFTRQWRQCPECDAALEKYNALVDEIDDALKSGAPIDESAFSDLKAKARNAFDAMNTCDSEHGACLGQPIRKTCPACEDTAKAFNAVLAGYGAKNGSTYYQLQQSFAAFRECELARCTKPNAGAVTLPGATPEPAPDPATPKVYYLIGAIWTPKPAPKPESLIGDLTVTPKIPTPETKPAPAPARPETAEPKPDATPKAERVIRELGEPRGIYPSRKPIEIGVVVLSELPVGQEISGRVVEDPKAYEDVPGLRVIAARIPVPIDSVVVDMGDGRKQPAFKPVTWVPSSGESSSTLTLVVHETSGAPPTTASVPVSRAPAPPADQPPAAGAQPLTMPPIAVAGGVQVIHGDCSGNSNAMSVTVDREPATIVAAKPGTVFWRVPKTTAPGAHEVTFVPGAGKAAVTLPLQVLGLAMMADRTNLLRGQSTRMHVTITGLDTLSADAWQGDLPSADLVDMQRVRERAPDFNPPRRSDPGVVLLVLENHSPSVILMGGHGDRIVLQLHQRDFSKGPYTYDDKLSSLQSGNFDIRGTVTAFLKQVSGRPAQ